MYANFSTALDLAHDATTMIDTENRRNMATFAINRLLEAQHTFNDYINDSFEKNINYTDKFILSLSLAYLARSRCYLELEEVNSATSCLNEGAKVIRCYVEKYVKYLLLYQPIAKVVPKTIGHNFVIVGTGSSLESSVELYRLASICKWLEPEFNRSLDNQTILFNAQGKNLVKFHQDEINTDLYNLAPVQSNITTSPVGAILAAATSVFPILTMPVTVGMAIGAIQAIQHSSKEEDTKSIEELTKEQTDNFTKKHINADDLLKVIENIEQIIETYNRFEAYLIELQVMKQVGMSFHNWLQLTPHTEAQQYKDERIYIIPLQPLGLK